MAKATGGYIQQLPSGAFRISVYAGTDPLTGRQIRLRRTCKTERAAHIELGRLLEQAAAGHQPDTDASVAQKWTARLTSLDTRQPASVSTASASRPQPLLAMREQGRSRSRGLTSCLQ